MRASIDRSAALSSVLVVRPSSMGDIIHALPIVADIAQHVPHVAVDWVAEDAFVSLVRLHTRVRRVIPVALRRWRHALFRRDTWTEVGTFRRSLRQDGYEAVLDLQEQMKGAMVARLARGVHHGFDSASVREPVTTFLHDAHHAVSPALHFEDRCRMLAGAALGYIPHGGPQYGITAPALQHGIAPAAPYAVCVHATSRADKLWPEGHWHELLSALAAERLGILLPWGSAVERARSVRLGAGHTDALVPPCHPLPMVAAILQSAALVVGVDTGLVHLAAALGTPTIALFTRTDPAHAGVAIAGPHAVDLGGEGVVPDAQAVFDAARRLLRDSSPR